MQNMCQHCEHEVGDCGCEGRGASGHCGCGEGSRESYVHRHYQTRAEKISEVETYLDELKSEIHAIEERLTDLRK